MNFNQNGIFQQYGALLIQIGRIIDGLIIFLSLYLSVDYYKFSWNGEYLVVALMGIIFFDITAFFFKFYRPWRVIRLSQEVIEIFLYLIITLFLVTFVLYFLEFEAIRNEVIINWFVCSFFLIGAYRGYVRILLRSFRTMGYDRHNVCFFGATATARGLANSFKVHPWMGIDVIGFFDDREGSDTKRLLLPETDLSGNILDLLELIKAGRVDTIYITLPMSAEKRIKELIDLFSDSTVSIFYCPDFTGFNMLNARWDNIYGQPIISIIDSPFSGMSGIIKRAEDLLLVALILPIILLPMMAIAIAIKLTSAGPVFYLQSRYGLDGKEFKIWKFRSMYTTEADHEFVQAKKNDARVTPLGGLLRKASLDELPQIINVLIGNMSVVGPRPHPVKLNEINRKQIYRYMLRHKIKPGITGLAQVNGFRGETESLLKMEKRIEYDLQYMKDWSPWLDLKILCKTVLTVFSDSNAY